MLKELTIEQMVIEMAEGTKIWALDMQNKDLYTLEEYLEGVRFLVDLPEMTESEELHTMEAEETTERRKVDHGRIVALYKANPQRSVSWIADDVGCSAQTVINHLKQEGIYKPKKGGQDE